MDGTRRGLALTGLLLACAPAVPGGGEGPSFPAPPAGCVRVASGRALQPLLDAAAPGASLCLEDGLFEGPLAIGPGVTLWGSRRAVVRGSGSDSTVRLEGEAATLLGLSVDGSGTRFDRLDAAVRVRADGARVEGVAVRNALFGILVERSRRVVVRGNEIEGAPGKALGMRGDGIRLWEVRDSRIERNRVRHGRDVVVWYSPGNRIEGNEISHGRYGTHLMYSHGNVLVGNRYVGNVVGIFAMYSRDTEVRGNLLAASGGAAGMGLGAKESGDLRVEENLFLADTVGAYLDTSPLGPDEHNRFLRNAFRLCHTAVVFHGNAERNAFADNRFRDNHVQVRVDGRGDALGAAWRRNEWDDYAGYDLDGDGIGDVPYELRSLSDELVARHPALAFFRGSPAIALVELVGRVVPIFRPRTLLVDPQPRTSAPPGSLPRAH